MAAQENASWDDRLKEAEIGRILAETEKFKLERKNLQREANQRWYKKAFSLKVFTFIVATVPILGFYMNYVVIPFMKSENIRLSKEVAVAQKKQELTGLGLKIAEAKLELSYVSQLTDIQSAYTMLDSQKLSLVKEYIRLGKLQELTKSQRDEYSLKVETLKKDLKAQKSKTGELTKKLALAETPQIMLTNQDVMSLGSIVELGDASLAFTDIATYDNSSLFQQPLSSDGFINIASDVGTSYNIFLGDAGTITLEDSSTPQIVLTQELQNSLGLYSGVAVESLTFTNEGAAPLLDDSNLFQQFRLPDGPIIIGSDTATVVPRPSFKK